jgi:hypothetical protein
MQQPNVPGILEKIEAESFLRPTFISSGYGMVGDIVGETEEVQTLLANKEASLPFMRARYRERDARMRDEIRLVYFVVFGLARDRQMVREISSYLKWCLDRPIEQLIWPWLAFLHGAHALELITGGQIRAPGTGGSAKQFDQFLTQVENWTDTHVNSSHEESH